MKVSWPYGSSTILKAMPTNGFVGIGRPAGISASGRRSCVALICAVQRRRQVARRRRPAAAARPCCDRPSPGTPASAPAPARPSRTTSWISSSRHRLPRPAAVPSARRCTSTALRACAAGPARPRRPARRESPRGGRSRRWRRRSRSAFMRRPGRSRPRNRLRCRWASCISTASQPSFSRNCCDDLVRIGAGAVHLVDERQPRHVVALHLAVDGQRLRLHAAHGAEHQDRPRRARAGCAPPRR